MVRTEWILVEDQLPDKTGEYYVYDPNSPLLNKKSIMRFDSVTKRWFDGDDCCHPSHWENNLMTMTEK